MEHRVTTLQELSATSELISFSWVGSQNTSNKELVKYVETALVEGRYLTAKCLYTRIFRRKSPLTAYSGSLS